MAKDLPYFKFFCSEWNDGDITLEEMEIQGLFINVCSYYWSNECNVSIDKLLKRFKHNKSNVEHLIKIGIIHNENGYLEINFLDEQKEDRTKTSKKNSEAGIKSAEARRLAKLESESNEKVTPVEITLNQNSTIKRREEKKREDKKRKEDIQPTAFSFYNSLINLGATKQLSNEWLAIRKNKKATNSETAFNAFKSQLNKTNANVNEVLELCVVNSWKGYNSSWYKEPNKEPRTKQEIYEEELAKVFKDKQR